MKRCVLLVISLILFASPAFAIDAQNFNVAIGSNNLFTLYQSAPLDKWQFCVGASSNFSGDPLMFTDADGEKINVIEQMVGNQFYSAFGIMGYVDIGVGFSFNRISGMDLDYAAAPVFSDENDLSFTGIGDVRATIKGRILKNKPKSVGLSVLPFASFPTGDPDYYNGAGALDAGGLLIIDKRFDIVNIIFNGGYKYKGISEGFNGADIIPKDEILFGLGLSVYAHRYIEVLAEVSGKTVDYQLDEIDPAVPIEFTLGSKLYAGYGMSFMVGGGGGITSGLGSPKYRFVLGFEFTTPPINRNLPAIKQGLAPMVDKDSKNQDTDHDGLMNWDETNTWGTDFMNPDTDDDGLKDGMEVREYKTDPLKPDTDGDNLTDGEEVKLYGSNPKLTDTDGDTLPDGLEAKELRTNPTNQDTDGDKIPDNIDGDPHQAETFNGYQDDDGVPEITLAKRPSGVIMFENVIWLPEPIQWTGPKNDVIAPESTPMVDDIAVMLTEYPDLKIQIDEHVARGGDEAANKRITQMHANVIRDYLENKGISPDRLIAVGHGSDFPIASNATPTGREKNTRTEIIVIK